MLARRKAASLSLPPVDLRTHVPLPSKSQGPRPLCVPFALGCAHEIARSVALSEQESLAVEAIWQHCLAGGTAGPYGTTLADAGSAMSATGQPPERLWPYDASLGSGTVAVSPGVATSEFRTASIISVPLLHDGMEDPVEQALGLGLAVALVVEVTDEFDDASSGDISVPPVTAPLGDYHAVLAVGAATNTNSTSRRVLVRNSWGAGWGVNGHAWLPYDYMVAHAVDAAVVDPASLGRR